jgi:hypothetical protein
LVIAIDGDPGGLDALEDKLNVGRDFALLVLGVVEDGGHGIGLLAVALGLFAQYRALPGVGSRRR